MPPKLGRLSIFSGLESLFAGRYEIGGALGLLGRRRLSQPVDRLPVAGVRRLRWRRDRSLLGRRRSTSRNARAGRKQVAELLRSRVLRTGVNRRVEFGHGLSRMAQETVMITQQQV